MNATSAGGHANPVDPMDGAPLDGGIVYDLVYAPADTAADRSARGAPAARRSAVIEMLIAQAERQFELWTGQRPPGVVRPRRTRRRRCRENASASRGGSRRMKQTTFEEFVELARRGTFVPVVKEIIADLLTPVSAFLKIAEHSDYAFLFESVEGGEQVARYSFLGKDPFLVLRARGRRRRSIERSGTTTAERRAVRPDAAAADGGVAVAVRARPAALHRRRRRVHRLRRRRRCSSRCCRRRGTPRRTRSVGRAGGVDDRKTTPASCCSTRCWRSITSSTGS